MTDDQLVKVIQKAVKDEVRPLKEQVEIVKNKISHLDLYSSVTSSNVRSLKEQQSVINEKLDGIDVIKQDLTDVKSQLSDLNDIIGNRMYPSVLEIEKNITAYGDIYKRNNDNSKKLDKRLVVVEDRLDIHPDPELSLAEVS